MLWFIIFLIVPTVWIVYASIFLDSFSLKEAGIQFGISVGVCLVLVLITYGSRYGSALDTEILNGQVVDKFSERVSCEHSYQCNPRTDSKGNTTYDTCYEHSFDIDWIVRTTVGNLTISRVNRQGTHEPPRFSDVVPGEPASVEGRYINYVRAVPESIFNEGDFTTTHNVAKYPRVHDYYRVRHVLNSDSGINQGLLNDWDSKLKHALITLGHQKQVNILVIPTQKPPSYANDLEYHWLRGKKNDVIVVIGVDESSTEVMWSRSFGWAESSRVFNEIENRLVGSEINEETIDIVINNVVEFYTRQSFDQYKYLIEEVKPSWWIILLLMIVNIIITGVVGRHFILHKM